MLYGESQTNQFVDAVRKLKEELRRLEKRAQKARQKAKDVLRKAPPR